MYKRAYYIYQEDLVKIMPQENGISITEIVKKLNEYCLSDMKKLRTTQITNYLIQKGYMFESEGIRRPTLKGNIIGIYEEKRKNEKNEEYSINLYDIKAQKYIYDNLYDIIKYYLMK